MKAASLLTLLLLLYAATSGQARTWRVNTAGTGDAPNLWAAMDSSAAGDTVLVAAGQYDIGQGEDVGGGLIVRGGVGLVGESGPAQTLLYDDIVFSISGIDLPTGAWMSGIHVRARANVVVYSGNGDGISYCILESDGPPVLSGWWNQSAPVVRNCLFIGGDVKLPAGYYFNIFRSALAHEASGAHFYENDVLGAVDPALDVSEGNLNFSLDPLFCGIEGSGNYFLQSISPCLPANSPYGIPEVIGPLGVGCGSVRVETRTWGGIKALYQHR